MSAKTETTKPTATISLFDAFGPNVSEQVKAINHRAAELSMDDMARVMGVTKSAVNASDKVGEVNWLVGLSNGDEEVLNATSDDRTVFASGIKTRWGDFGACKLDPLLTGSASSPVRAKDSRAIERAVESTSAAMRRLKDSGVDSRSMVVAINYTDPETGAPRTVTVDNKPASGSGSVFFQRLRPQKRLKRMMHDITSSIALLTKK